MTWLNRVVGDDRATYRDKDFACPVEVIVRRHHRVRLTGTNGLPNMCSMPAPTPESRPAEKPSTPRRGSPTCYYH